MLADSSHVRFGEGSHCDHGGLRECGGADRGHDGIVLYSEQRHRDGGVVAGRGGDDCLVVHEALIARGGGLP